ncbi:MAG: hypothetical protein ABJA75_03180 [Bradyrhizobium sp.]
MSKRNTAMQDYILISRVAHVIERSGLAMAGAMCGTFVGAQLAKANVALFESVGFIASMILIGMIAFYVGIDVPRVPARSERESVDAVEVLSAAGTFLATVAALISVFSIVFDEAPQRLWEFVVGSWWLGGVTMQIAAGSIGRLRANTRVARQTTDGRQAQ